MVIDYKLEQLENAKSPTFLVKRISSKDANCVLSESAEIDFKNGHWKKLRSSMTGTLDDILIEVTILHFSMDSIGIFF